ncbi:hypothetical protein SRB17_37280 [Streptomyces sp. RB17]|uniref:acyl-CoA dehydrogenase family protein n=1 Tax=Streptomyces sp. RB17 TaxID=2585197 RepID=UPI001309A313|nr:acyl-CoA dehydrogenase family protein [Streptomyces sp. RB17]MQY35737.1 hypothetical protein [Streptomyces sp. RB17]
MHLAPTERQQRPRPELRGCFRAVLPDHRDRCHRRDHRDDRDHRDHRGQAGATDARAPVRRIGAAGVFAVAPNTVGPILMKYGSERQNAHLLPRILGRDAAFAIGCTEPSTGTALAPLRTRPEGEGWSLMAGRLTHERVALAALGMRAEDVLAAVLTAARTPDQVNLRCRIDEPWVGLRGAEAHVGPAAKRLLSRRLLANVGAGRPPLGEASGVKSAGTESAVATYRMCQEIAGEAGLIRSGFPGAFGDGERQRLNRTVRINTFGGGVSEVQREIVVTMRLGMTRGRR